MTIAIPVTIPIKKIQLNPGSTISIHDVTWEQFEAILEEREAEGIRIYEALEVPEVWVYTAEKFTINVLTDGKYIESNTSPTFPNLPILELIPDLVKQAFKKGSSNMLRELRKQMS